jgi:hypothetical protein
VLESFTFEIAVGDIVEPLGYVDRDGLCSAVIYHDGKFKLIPLCHLEKVEEYPNPKIIPPNYETLGGSQ